MKKVIFVLLFALTGIIAQAQIPNGYYDNAVGKTGEELRSALHDIIDNHTTISYQQIWTAFWSTDNKGNNVVWDMYSDIPGGTPSYTYNYYNNNQCGEYDSEGDCYNREHSWPQSWFSNDGTPTTDMHHIFPTDGFVNQQRSNYPFGEVQNTEWTSSNGSKLGYCKTSLGYNGKVFEPIDEYKGDFARALMYMSVRYYGEDSNWGTSGMTDKADIRPWAIAMLLDWSDNDPVSQKEIDRNNVIYNDIQHNRNPFIDHPEYAHIIWEEGWSGVTYSITCAPVQNGSISAPTSAAEGSLVNLTATPNPGYMIHSWTVYKTEDPNTTVSVSNNGTFTMPAFNVTVSATFIQNNTYYSITCDTNLANGSISTSTNSAISGTTVTLSNTPAYGYILYAYYVYKTGDINTVAYTGQGTSFTMPAYDVTISASFVLPTNYSYVKITSTPSDWSGDYLLVYENNSFSAYVWTGVDATNCYVEKNINDNTIADGNLVSLTANPMSVGYSLKINGGSNNGKYISGTNNQNKINFGSSPASNTLVYGSDGVKITSNTSVLRYNTEGYRFRYYKSSTYSSQQPVQLYKKTGHGTVPIHSIQFEPNGASGSSYSQTVNEFEPTALLSNAFTRDSFAFCCWNTQADGLGTSYFDGATVTLLNDLILFAQWDPIYTISCTPVEHGNIGTSGTEATEGTLITLIATPDNGYELETWIVTDDNDNPIEVVNNQFEMPASNVTVSANFVFVGQSFEQKYYPITSTDQLVAGRTYLIVNTAAAQAMSITQNTNNRGATAVTISNGCIASIGNNVCEFTLGGTSGAWTFFDANWGEGGGYLYAASSGNNWLRTQTTNDANGEWAISIENGITSVTAQGNNTRNTLRYNTSKLFSCYASNASTTNMPTVTLYVRSEAFEYTENTLVECLNTFDSHTIRSGATLTANTVLGMNQSNNPNHILIEDGAQFVHNTAGLKATFKKGITGYTTEGGWYTLAMPFYNYDIEGELNTGSYDLYAYNESCSLEWLNYKNHADDFIVNPSAGYLYAHHPSTTLRMTGTLNSGDYTETVNLSYASSNDAIRGYNLLGNPTAHDISFTKSSEVADGYYYLNNSSSWIYVASNTVPAGRGFLVKANAPEQTVTLNISDRQGMQTIGALLKIDVDGERVYVNMTDGVGMPMLSFHDKTQKVSLVRDGKPYIMLVNKNAESLELNYQPTDGHHSLSVEFDGSLPNYLHLIDNLTDADIDLLQTTSYDFTSRKDDDASRFRLIFK